MPRSSTRYWISLACTGSRLAAFARLVPIRSFWSSLSVSTSWATSSVIDSSSGLRSSGLTLPAVTRESIRILMLTSWSEQSTPAELSIASVLIRPPARSNSTRPKAVTPRLPPSPITLART